MSTPPAPPPTPPVPPPAYPAHPQPPPEGGGSGSAGWLIGCAIAAAVGLVMLAVLGLLAAIAVPSFVQGRDRSQMYACINNLRMIDGAKDLYMLEHGADPADIADLVRENILAAHPTCPAGGTYTLGAGGEDPTCSIPDHELPSSSASVLTPIHPVPAPAREAREAEERLDPVPPGFEP